MPPPDLYNYTGPYSIWLEPPAIIETACPNHNPLGKLYSVVGCSYTINGYCYIMIDKTLSDHNYKTVRKHELAHCAGWPGDHPNAHKELFYPKQVGQK